MWAGSGGFHTESADGRHRLGAVVRQVVRDDGVTGLWRGTVPTVAR